MTTRLELQNRIQRILGDPSGTQYSVDLVLDGIVESISAILPWVYKAQVSEFAGDAGTLEYSLPADFYKVIGVFDTKTGRWIPEGKIVAGESTADNIIVNNDWILFPEGSISFANPVDVGQSAILHYAASWTVPTVDASVLEVPTWVNAGLTYYAASYVLVKSSVDAANVRQWNVQIDSGTPVMNPMSDQSEKLFQRFINYMNMMTPNRVKGVRS